MPPPILPITDPELIAAVAALTCAAESYRKAFLILADRRISLAAIFKGNPAVRAESEFAGRIGFTKI